ncbi:MAG: hypothetical protein IT373_12395 [Polyangiaceae bacterium]|nr:hypothetical protein [Polyangiaceae bacterium]
MKSTKSLRRVTALPALLVLVGAPVLLAGGCKKALEGALDCDASLEVKFEALSNAADALVNVSTSLKASVATACFNIATDLGEAPPADPANYTDDDVTTACNLATAALNAEFTGGADINLVIEGGHCEVNAQAQFNCEASCDVSGSCTPGSIEVQCDPGELSVVCEGSCDVGATCEGSVGAGAVECNGTCEGNCTGTCSTGEPDGSHCAGTCDGSCTGDCTLTGPTVSGSCGGTAKCTGGCTGAYSAPSCTGTLNPPACNIDAECEAGCQGQASLEASCTPPSVSIEVVAAGSANLQSTLEANLPAIWNAFELQGKVAFEAAGSVADAFGGVVSAMGTIPSCALLFVGDVVGAVTGTVSASVSLSVSVNASASVGGSASGG